MNNNRRKFVRNVGLSFLGLPLVSNYAFGSESNTHRAVFTNRIGAKVNGYQVLSEESFMLNNGCKATPLLKEKLLLADQEGLLVELKDKSSFVLNEKQLQLYRDFLSSFKQSLKDGFVHNSTKIDFATMTTPVKILKSNSTNDFRFKNANGNIIEVHSSRKGSHVRFS